MTDAPDTQDIAELADCIDTLVAATEDLREFGEEHDLPVVERTADRLEGTVDVLEQNVPRELLEEGDGGQ